MLDSVSKPVIGSVYIHIPYCIQKCVYCDFATYEQSKIMPIDDYISLLCLEIQARSTAVEKEILNCLYFGGGTPSLLNHDQLEKILMCLRDSGWNFGSQTQVCLEINPGTLTDQRLEDYSKSGVNRFSLGVQTFNENSLKQSKREHSAKETLETLRILSQRQVNFSVDLLFGLPAQTIDQFLFDLDLLLEFSPPHVSGYCLTVDDRNPMAKNRPDDFVQIEMFKMLKINLESSGIYQYEASNYSRPGYESKSNLGYWTDQPYLGFGLSSHSYAKSLRFGERFWNPKTIASYAQFVGTHCKNNWNNHIGVYSQLNNLEALTLEQSITDFLLTSFRLVDGLSFDRLKAKYSPKIFESLVPQLYNLAKSEPLNFNLLDHPGRMAFSFAGRMIANQLEQKVHQIISGKFDFID